MLNKLSQLVDAIERLCLDPPSRHGRISPMAKNSDLLIVFLASNGAPNRVENLAGSDAASLFRVEHGSAGSSFPGFNLPTPLRCLDKIPIEELKSAVKHLLDIVKDKSAANVALAGDIRDLFKLSRSCEFTTSQKMQFKRSCSELVVELQKNLSRIETARKTRDMATSCVAPHENAGRGLKL